MNTIEDQIRNQGLLRIKKIIDKDRDGDRFIIVRTKKNIEFMREYSLDLEDIKDIIRQLSIEDCFSGPETDRAPQYKGWIFKFSPIFEETKLTKNISINSSVSSCLCVR